MDQKICINFMREMKLNAPTYLKYWLWHLANWYNGYKLFTKEREDVNDDVHLRRQITSTTYEKVEAVKKSGK